MRVKVLSNINNGQFNAGDVTEFEDGEAQQLIEAGAAVAFDGSEQDQEQPAAEASESNEDTVTPPDEAPADQPEAPTDEDPTQPEAEAPGTDAPLDGAPEQPNGFPEPSPEQPPTPPEEQPAAELPAQPTPEQIAQDIANT